MKQGLAVSALLAVLLATPATADAPATPPATKSFVDREEVVAHHLLGGDYTLAPGYFMNEKSYAVVNGAFMKLEQDAINYQAALCGAGILSGILSIALGVLSFLYFHK